jgi:hypothetical protein
LQRPGSSGWGGVIGFSADGGGEEFRVVEDIASQDLGAMGRFDGMKPERAAYRAPTKMEQDERNRIRAEAGKLLEVPADRLVGASGRDFVASASTRFGIWGFMGIPTAQETPGRTLALQGRWA